MVRGLVDGGRADMARARWSIPGPRRAGWLRGALHVELWVADIAAAKREWGWLLGRLGYRLGDDWGHGQAWRAGVALHRHRVRARRGAGSARPRPTGTQPPRLPRGLPRRC